MPQKSTLILAIPVLFLIVLSACAPAAPTAAPAPTNVPAPATARPVAPPTSSPPTAAPTAPPTSPPPPTAAPTTAPAKPTQPVVWSLLPQADCEKLQQAVAQAVGAQLHVSLTTKPFEDYVDRTTGSGCEIQVTGGTGANFQNAGQAVDTVGAILKAQGWKEDQNFAAGGPTSIDTAFRNGNQLALLNAGWSPSPDANCPNDQPISACKLTPAQMIYTITLQVAQQQ